MGDYLKNILPDKPTKEPAEFRIIRDFMHKNFNETPELQVQNRTIVIKVAGSGLAGSLQMQLHELKEQLPEGTKLRIQIS